MRRKLSKAIEVRQKRVGTLLTLPWIIGLFVFTLYPLFYSIWLSLCSVEFTNKGIRTTFLGFKWYVEALRTDPNFVPHLLDTLKFVGFLTPMILVVSVLFAILLNKAMVGQSFFRALFFFPVVFINGPVMGKLIGNDATSIIKPSQYVVYQIIETLPDVISVPLLYIFDNVIMILWFSGIQILIMLSALQKVNISLYEAAEIDGGSKWQIFWKITLPSLKSMLLVCAIYTIVDLSCYSGNRVTAYIKNNMHITTKPYSFSAAMSWIYTLTIFILLLIAFFILKEKEENKK